jgi:hypothetical protein
VAEAVSAVPGLRLLLGGESEPPATVVAFTSTDPELDLFVLADELSARGWHTQPQLSYGGLPRSIHLTVTASMASSVVGFAAELAASAAAARKLGPVPLPPELRVAVADLRPEEITAGVITSLAGSLGLGAADEAPLPARQALINTLLDAAPVSVRAALLAAFLRHLQRPTF